MIRAVPDLPDIRIYRISRSTGYPTGYLVSGKYPESGRFTIQFSTTFSTTFLYIIDFNI